MADGVNKQVFMVVGIRNPTAIEERIKSKSLPHFGVKDDVWLIAFNGSTKDLAEELGIRDGSVGTGLVSPISGYSGRAPQETWEWLKLNWPNDG